MNQIRGLIDCIVRNSATKEIALESILLNSDPEYWRKINEESACKLIPEINSTIVKNIISENFVIDYEVIQCILATSYVKH